MNPFSISDLFDLKTFSLYCVLYNIQLYYMYVVVINITFHFHCGRKTWAILPGHNKIFITFMTTLTQYNARLPVKNVWQVSIQKLLSQNLLHKAPYYMYMWQKYDTCYQCIREAGKLIKIGNCEREITNYLMHYIWCKQINTYIE